MGFVTAHNIEAVIFDMDGVLTQTASLHAEAWKAMFDEYLQKKDGDSFKPLSIESDYKQHIDGIPRFDGVREFLDSRDIDVPEGTPHDDPAQETIYGLGMRKNELFLDLLEKEGAHVFEDTLRIIKDLKKEKVKIAVISSSRNCRKIIEQVGLSHYFDAIVDGITSEKENIEGKPAPDIFLYASKQLDVEPSQTMVVEDAISGVKAGKAGKFTLVVGLARNNEEVKLREAGADIVIQKLTHLKTNMNDLKDKQSAEALPDALEQFNKIVEKIGSKEPVLFLDYDGTLTPIVSEPDDAILSEETKETLSNLSEVIQVAIISGRDRKDIQSRIDIENLIYAGSHGFDIKGPKGISMQYEPGKKALPQLDEIEKEMEHKLKDIKGAQVERKKYAIAVHYRNVDSKAVEKVKGFVEEAVKAYDKLRIGTGKMILEVKPDLDWNKGRALDKLMEELKLSGENHMPIFIGDDLTDEDALIAIRENGVGIIVGSHEEKTAASYRLDDSSAVVKFLNQIYHRFSG